MAPADRVYGAKERARLGVLADSLTAPAIGVLGAATADRLRTELPDLDDLTIGRVLIALTQGLPQMFIGEGTSLDAAWQGLTAAGLTLTEPEWKEGTS